MLKRAILPILLSMLISSCSNSSSGNGGSSNKPSGLPDWMNDSTSVNGYVPERQIRLIALAQPMRGGEWMATKKNGLKKDYNAQDILEMIEDLKPTTLERFFTGCQDMNKQVPVRAGYPPMTIKEFLNKAMELSAPGCEIIPKLNLQWLQNDSDFFWKCAEEIVTYDLIRPIRNINLDCWDVYCKTIHTTEAERDAMFARLREIGYTQIGVNFTGLIRNHKDIDYCDISINKDDWTVHKDNMDKVHGFENIKKVYLYIDYPGMTEMFMAKDPDEQARIYCEEIYPYQRKYNFNFVYAIIQDFWGAGEIQTSKNGRYGGKTMYDISKELLFKSYNK